VLIDDLLNHPKSNPRNEKAASSVEAAPCVLLSVLSDLAPFFPPGQNRAPLNRCGLQLNNEKQRYNDNNYKANNAIHQFNFLFSFHTALIKTKHPPVGRCFYFHLRYFFIT
jgi:hypothetical protein